MKQCGLQRVLSKIAVAVRFRHRYQVCQSTVALYHVNLPPRLLDKGNCGDLTDVREILVQFQRICQDFDLFLKPRFLLIGNLVRLLDDLLAQKIRYMNPVGHQILGARTAVHDLDVRYVPMSKRRSVSKDVVALAITPNRNKNLAYHPSLSLRKGRRSGRLR